jgi:hypothetical protein
MTFFHRRNCTPCFRWKQIGLEGILDFTRGRGYKLGVRNGE